MAAINDYQGYEFTRESSAAHFAVVTPDDNNDLAHVTRAIIVAVAGNLKVTSLGGETAVLPLPAGQFSIMATRIHSTSTTATGITALW